MFPSSKHIESHGLFLKGVPVVHQLGSKPTCAMCLPGMACCIQRNAANYRRLNWSVMWSGMLVEALAWHTYCNPVLHCNWLCVSAFLLWPMLGHASIVGTRISYGQDSCNVAGCCNKRKHVFSVTITCHVRPCIPDTASTSGPARGVQPHLMACCVAARGIWQAMAGLSTSTCTKTLPAMH